MSPVSLVLACITQRLLALVLLLVLAGCASTDTASKSQPPRPSFALRHNNPEVARDSLRAKEAAGLVKAMLIDKGFREASPNAKPDLLVEFNYGIGPPEVVQDAVWRREMIEAPTEFVTQTRQTGTDASGNPIYGQVTAERPKRIEFKGYQSEELEVLVYRKHLYLAARPYPTAPATSAAPVAWALDISCECISRDVRGHLPELITLCRSHLERAIAGNKPLKVERTYRGGGLPVIDVK